MLLHTLEGHITNEDGSTINAEEEVAEAFNEFFIDKVEQLKRNIDPGLVEDPLARIKDRMKDNTTIEDGTLCVPAFNIFVVLVSLFY